MSLDMMSFTKYKGIIFNNLSQEVPQCERTCLFLSDGIYASTLPGARCSLHKCFKWRVCVCLWVIVHLPHFHCSDWPLTHPPTAPSITLTRAPASSHTLLCLYGHQASPEMRKSDLYKSLDVFGEETWGNRCYSGSRGLKGKDGDTSKRAQVLCGWPSGTKAIGSIPWSHERH